MVMFYNSYSKIHTSIVSRNDQVHAFHLVDPSPWPITAAFSALMLTSGGVLTMHGYNPGTSILFLGFLLLIFTKICWWRDVIREATFEGQHTSSVQTGLKMGMILFIVSEIMFFFAFFWAFFYLSVNSTSATGGVWPPADSEILDTFQIPLLNTILLLSSGASVTLAHESIIFKKKSQAVLGLVVTIFLAIIFTSLQGFEYVSAPFNITDSAYGSTFYMATGFHGFHVLVGTFFLMVCFVRLYLDQFSSNHHIGFEAACWYWHFVDVVWLFLIVTIYWWGS